MFGGCRAFIDRFNALSAWVTSSILQQAELGARAERVTFFIRVGGHLAELANFNGLMVVVTALQQGCVTRLKWTFEQVPKAERAKLGQLQVRQKRGERADWTGGAVHQSYSRLLVCAFTGRG